MTDLTDPHDFLPDPLVILKPTVKPDILTIVKKPKIDTATHFSPVWDVSLELIIVIIVIIARIIVMNLTFPTVLMIS